MWFHTNWRWNHLLFFGNLKQIDKDRPWDFFSCSRNTYPVRPWDSPRVHQVVWRGCTVQQEEEIWLHRSLPLGKVSFFHVKKKAKEQKRRSWTKLFALIGKVPIFFHFEIWPFHPQGALSISFFIEKLTFHPHPREHMRMADCAASLKDQDAKQLKVGFCGAAWKYLSHRQISCGNENIYTLSYKQMATQKYLIL